MSINNADKKRFRQIGHDLKPIVTIAQKGLTENILLEVKRALNDHELIKIKVVGADRDQKKELVDVLCTEMNAECVQTVGHVILLYKAAKKPYPRLSNLLRAQQK